MELGPGADRRAFERTLHEVNAPARAVQIIAQHLVARAGGGAEAAVHALAQDALGFAPLGGISDEFGKARLHGRGYTFFMSQVFAFLLIAALAGLGFWYWSWRRRWEERQRVSEERLASVMVQAMSARAKPAADPVGAAQQKLLYEAATKAGEAGEPVLAIQLYARLISRYPESELGTQARAAVEAQKKKLAKP
jgi:hypothetical protein